MNAENTTQHRIAGIIELLTLSQIPPSFQEAVINNLHQLNSADLDAITEALQTLRAQEQSYAEAATGWVKTCKEIGRRIGAKLEAEALAIEAELEQELVKL
jgi:hypothetical protein